MDNKTKKLVIAALFAALACAATMVVRIPTPGTGGYIHPGDAIVILSGVFLGPVYGGLAAGIGSAMSDLLGGYFLYVPITFLIKGAVGFLAGKAFGSLKEKGKPAWVGVAVGGVLDILLVVFGYWICEVFLYGFYGAVESMLPNLIQGIGGLVLSLVLYPVISAIPDFSYLSDGVPHRRK